MGGFMFFLGGILPPGGILPLTGNGAIDLCADLFFPVIANGKRKANNTCI